MAGAGKDAIGVDWTSAIVYGVDANDTVTGSIYYSSNDTVYGGAGNDTVTGGSGNDLIYGGDNADVAAYSRARGDYTVTQTGDGGYIVGANYGPDGDDTVYSVETRRVPDVEMQIDANTGQICTLAAGAGLTSTTAYDDIITGSSEADQISANGGNDRINAGAGDDVIFADGVGGDALTHVEAGLGTPGNDVVHGGEGNDSISGGGGYDQLHGDEGNDSILGDAGNDTLYGELGDDTLEGVAGAYSSSDTLGVNAGSGGDGNDWINAYGLVNGDAGDDTVYGLSLIHI